MKTCAYCGRQNQTEATNCCECGTDLREAEAEAVDPALTDPGNTLVAVADYPDLVRAEMLRTDLEAAGIPACIPEELAPNSFGHFFPLAHITVQVAAKDLAAAKEVLANRPSAD